MGQLEAYEALGLHPEKRMSKFLLRATCIQRLETHVFHLTEKTVEQEPAPEGDHARPFEKVRAAAARRERRSVHVLSEARIHSR